MRTVTSSNPLYQKRIGEHLEVELRHSFIPFVFHSIAYKRSWGPTAITLVLTKKVFGGGEFELYRQEVTARDYLLDVDLELQHGESIRFRTEGAIPPNESHEVVIAWSERKAG